MAWVDVPRLQFPTTILTRTPRMNTLSIILVITTRRDGTEGVAIHGPAHLEKWALGARGYQAPWDVATRRLEPCTNAVTQAQTLDNERTQVSIATFSAASEAKG